MRTSSPASPQRRRTIVFLATTPLPELDLFGPAEIFKTANVLKQDYEIVLVSGSRSRTLIGATGIRVTAACTFRDFDRPIDTLIVLGDPATSESLKPDLLDWLRQRAATSRRVCSICTGAFILAEAGLLKGRAATTHWLYEERFRARFPETDLDISAIWKQDGNVYTSAGVSTGMDLALALVEEDCGSAIALKIAKGLVLFLRRSGSQNQFSQFVTNEKDAGRLGALPAWLLANMGGDLSVEALASWAALSPRQFCRNFKRTFRMSPGSYVRKMRLEEAKRCLETTQLDWKSIASRCGVEAEVFRRAFMREFGVSPHGYAMRYSVAQASSGR